MNLTSILKYFLIILIPPLIILANFNFLFLNKNFYQKLYQKSGTYQNFTQKEVESQTDNLFGYFRGKNKLDHNFFSNQAVLHLQDVKTLTQTSKFLFYLTLISVVLAAVYLASKRKYKEISGSFFFGSLITLIFILFLALGLFKTFDSLFTLFHKISFRSNLWLFPQDDSLVKLFPPQFFAAFADRLALNILISSALISAVSLLAKSKIKK